MSHCSTSIAMNGFFKLASLTTWVQSPGRKTSAVLFLFSIRLKSRSFSRKVWPFTRNLWLMISYSPLLQIVKQGNDCSVLVLSTTSIRIRDKWSVKKKKKEKQVFFAFFLKRFYNQLNMQAIFGAIWIRLWRLIFFAGCGSIAAYMLCLWNETKVSIITFAFQHLLLVLTPYFCEFQLSWFSDDWRRN